MLEELYEIIEDRKRNPVEDSYTAKLLYGEKGINGILEKLGEEMTEVILAVKDGKREEVVYEVADLLYHLLVLLSKLEIRLEEVYDELARRRK
ncbi:phosphoribosyl-ATP pyrophosphatase [Geoglobus ahangari]|uniref:Phosphoribosyl-ATP pyrophosphatase n=1 Tax=Geoglobus ahangari TaxID=113653 RepID=A0A0F7IH34_9EURY|nr:phosphoribosyl-ATP diphosphatase [Geoglobus ahangari]AKG92622.1 phosphoribosyl-ATP pyrophosphatase [Geoglobus ahangari]